MENVATFFGRSFSQTKNWSGKENLAKLSRQSKQR
jgi:hypothetical protein